jgi:hypothetical protein
MGWTCLKERAWHIIERSWKKAANRQKTNGKTQEEMVGECEGAGNAKVGARMDETQDRSRCRATVGEAKTLLGYRWPWG